MACRRRRCHCHEAHCSRDRVRCHSERPRGRGSGLWNFQWPGRTAAAGRANLAGKWDEAAHHPVRTVTSRMSVTLFVCMQELMPRVTRPIATVRTRSRLLMRSFGDASRYGPSPLSLSLPLSHGLSTCAQGELPADLRQQITFIYCDDIVASEAFYSNKIGLPLVRSEDTPVRLRSNAFSVPSLINCVCAKKLHPCVHMRMCHAGQAAAFSGLPIRPPR